VDEVLPAICCPEIWYAHLGCAWVLGAMWYRGLWRPDPRTSLRGLLVDLIAVSLIMGGYFRARTLADLYWKQIQDFEECLENMKPGTLSGSLLGGSDREGWQRAALRRVKERKEGWGYSLEYLLHMWGHSDEAEQLRWCSPPKYVWTVALPPDLGFRRFLRIRETLIEVRAKQLQLESARTLVLDLARSKLPD